MALLVDGWHLKAGEDAGGGIGAARGNGAELDEHVSEFQAWLMFLQGILNSSRHSCTTMHSRMPFIPSCLSVGALSFPPQG